MGVHGHDQDQAHDGADDGAGDVAPGQAPLGPGLGVVVVQRGHGRKKSEDSVVAAERVSGRGAICVEGEVAGREVGEEGVEERLCMRRSRVTLMSPMHLFRNHKSDVLRPRSQ